jgi:hypothetical protein
MCGDLRLVPAAAVVALLLSDADIVAFRSAKGRTFAERKVTHILL